MQSLEEAHVTTFADIAAAGGGAGFGELATSIAAGLPYVGATLFPRVGAAGASTSAVQDLGSLALAIVTHIKNAMHKAPNAGAIGSAVAAAAGDVGAVAVTAAVAAVAAAAGAAPAAPGGGAGSGGDELAAFLDSLAARAPAIKRPPEEEEDKTSEDYSQQQSEDDSQQQSDDGSGRWE